MKTNFYLFMASTLFWGTGCIQEEPLCPEAEITSFSIPSDVAYSETMINQGQNTIEIFVKPETDLSRVAPQVEVNESSTVSPASGETVDFSDPVVYTVTAEDGIHTRDYTVNLIPMNDEVFTSLMLKFDFDHWETHSTYNYATPVQQAENGLTFNIFSSGNQGVVLYQQYPTAEQYPTFPIVSEGGYAAKMVTQKGPGSILGIQYIPVIAGSLFTGTMNLLNALANPLTATQMGRPFNQIPKRLMGYYKYKSGTGDYIGPDGQPRPNVQDSCAIYAVFYRVDNDLETLDGTNIHGHPNIVSLAMLPNRASTAGDMMLPFDIPFERQNQEVIDFSKHEYKLAVVLSSSFWGDRYEGTPGSELVVDNIEILTEDSTNL